MPARSYCTSYFLPVHSKVGSSFRARNVSSDNEYLQISKEHFTISQTKENIVLGHYCKLRERVLQHLYSSWQLALNRSSHSTANTHTHTHSTDCQKSRQYTKLHLSSIQSAIIASFTCVIGFAVNFLSVFTNLQSYM